MRPSRMAILLLAGLVALHVFMLAGHGRRHHAPIGVPMAAEHTGSSMPPSLAVPMPSDEDSAGMDMTVACLAVVAGLLLLLPRRSGQPAAPTLQRLIRVGHPAHSTQAGPRTRSLAELCISLT
jgi:hypothetical protein